MPELSGEFTEGWSEALEEGVSFPASYAQERLWLAQESAPDSAARNLWLATRLRGKLELEALERSLADILRRHQVLRTSFDLVEGKLRQIVAPNCAFRLRLLSLPARPLRGFEEDLRALLQAESNRPFTLLRSPLLRATLLRLGDTEHVLLLVVHPVAADGCSLGILASELAAFYAAFTHGEPCPLAPLSLQFGDYAAWEREEAQGGGWHKQLAYWRRQLDGAPLLQLPTDRPRRSGGAFRDALHCLVLPFELSAALRKRCQAERVTPFMLLLAGFGALLHATTGQPDLVIATPASTRTREELEPIIGCLVNLLPLRLNASADQNFSGFLQRAKEVVLSASTSQEVPFERVLEDVRPQWPPQNPPFLRALFTCWRASVQLRLPGLNSELIGLEALTAKSDLSLEWRTEEQTLEARLAYRTDLFEPATIAGLADRYRAILQQLANGDDPRLCPGEPKWVICRGKD
jgi:hypothetical protein